MEFFEETLKNGQSIYSDRPVLYSRIELPDYLSIEAPDPQFSYAVKFHYRPKQNEAEKYTCNASGYLMGENGSKSAAFFKKIFCGKEWCKCCGKEESVSHLRRISRIYPKLMPQAALGYLVITTPDTLRAAFLNVEILRKFKTYWKRKLKREYPNAAGLIRWHWCGEDETTFKPHLNILFNNSWIEAETLERWRHELKFWFKKQFNIDTDKTPEANIYYNYTKAEGKKYHRIKYITRATLINFENNIVKDYFQKEMKNYKNTTLFGEFPKSEQAPQDAAATILNKNIDPETNEPIIWNSYARNMDEVVHKNFRHELGLGIWKAYKCYTNLKYNDKISNLGKPRKLMKLKEQKQPGEFFEHIKKREKLNRLKDNMKNLFYKRGL